MNTLPLALGSGGSVIVGAAEAPYTGEVKAPEGCSPAAMLNPPPMKLPNAPSAWPIRPSEAWRIAIRARSAMIALAMSLKDALPVVASRTNASSKLVSMLLVAFLVRPARSCA